MPTRLRIDNTIRLFVIALLTVGIGSCSEDMGVYDIGAEPLDAVLHLTTGGSITRGDTHYADDPYAEGEEAISRVSLFFFDEKESKGSAFYTYDITNVNQVTTADLTVKVPVELKNKFSDDKAYVYALVNLPKEITIEETTNMIGGKSATLENLNSVWVSAPEFASAGIPAMFVMRGGSTVELTSEGNLGLVTGTIKIERLAAKIRLWAEIPEKIHVSKTTGKTLNRADYDTEAEWNAAISDEGVEEWTSVPTTNQNGTEISNVRLYLYNYAAKGRIDAYIGTAEDRDNNLLGYNSIDRSYDEEDNIVRLLEKNAILPPIDKDDKYNYSHSIPYYSYPNIWDSTTPSEKHQTYVTLSMPWRNDKEGMYQVCYYQIPVNALKNTTDNKEADRLDPNRYYRIKIRIGMLGSKDLGSPTEIDASYEVVDWTGANVDVNIKNRRYLVVNQKEWVMNNVWTLQIPFSSSHETVITDCYVNYFRYNDIWGTAANTDDKHNKEEFNKWVEAAKGLTEGLISATYETDKGSNIYNVEELYYKKEYFYDDVYYSLNQPKDGERGFRYYVGHEHPKTFQTNARLFDNVPSEFKNKWDTYNEKYDNINAIYTYSIDNEKGIINFKHPLVRWEEVREEETKDGKKYSKVKYYVPAENNNTKGLYEEFSRCEITIVIKHKDWNDTDDLYKETIHITQYPSMYIEVSHNYGDVKEAKSDSRTGDGDYNDQKTHNQYVLVNGNYTQKHVAGLGGEAASTKWYEVNKDQVSRFVGANNNPNMYIIHTTQFSEDNEVKYDLGDPRTLFYNNILTSASFNDYTWKNKNTANNDGSPSRWSNADLQGVGYLNSDGPAWWTSRSTTASTGWGGTTYRYTDYNLVQSLFEELKPENSATRPPENSNTWDNYVNHKNNLCFYYPTDESTGAGSKENFVAPSFRIASSFGKVTQMDMESARKRCATYQEAGRPAGRWRLPTKAEVRYIAQLSADGKIPVLFGNTDAPEDYGHYWTANGKVEVNAKGNVTDGTHGDSEYSPRCVYDEWYWTKINEEINYNPYPLETNFIWGDRPKDNTQVQTLIKQPIYQK